MNEVKVSILCLAFNHKEFIAQAIEGFLKQKTTFAYEIIIHDDASTDGTTEIIREYEQKYPDLIRPIYQTENQYSKGVSINKEFFLPKMRGEYVALCDGDDYWTDPQKLQKQVDALEAHPDCLMCLHKVWDYDARAGAEQPKKYLPKAALPSGMLSSDELMSLIGNGDFFNEVCYFFRSDTYREYQENYPAFAHAYMKNKTDDMPMLLYFGSKANVYYIADEMAVYRRLNTGSWSDQQKKKNNTARTIFYRNSIEAINQFNQFSDGRFVRQLDYIDKFFAFRYLACVGNYKEMLTSQYDCVWVRQNQSYRKRIELLSQNEKVWGIVFRAYDALRGIGKWCVWRRL